MQILLVIILLLMSGHVAHAQLKAQATYEQINIYIFDYGDQAPRTCQVSGDDNNFRIYLGNIFTADRGADAGTTYLGYSAKFYQKTLYDGAITAAVASENQEYFNPERHLAPAELELIIGSEATTFADPDLIAKLLTASDAQETLTYAYKAVRIDGQPEIRGTLPLKGFRKAWAYASRYCPDRVWNAQY
jgi:hypothetical protein